MKEFIGIDNGRTGAIAHLRSDGDVTVEPVKILDLGKECLLDVQANLFILRSMLESVGAARHEVLVAYEQSQIDPRFGCKNNFTNGKHGEFWRVLLSVEQIPFVWVNPQSWQKELFRGIRGEDTKAMAELVRQQRFPTLNLGNFGRKKVEGINDALCIALWARHHWATQKGGNQSTSNLENPSCAARQIVSAKKLPITTRTGAEKSVPDLNGRISH